MKKLLVVLSILTSFLMTSCCDDSCSKDKECCKDKKECCSKDKEECKKECKKKCDKDEKKACCHKKKDSTSTEEMTPSLESEDEVNETVDSTVAE